MPKANLTLPDGTLVSIDGSTEEVAKLLQNFSGSGGVSRSGRRRSAPRTAATSGKGKARPRGGPTTYILELREEGYFKTKRFLNEVQQKLEEKGHIYARTTLSPTLLNLVKRRELRRIKDKKGWAYVH